MKHLNPKTIVFTSWVGFIKQQEKGIITVIQALCWNGSDRNTHHTQCNTIRQKNKQ